MFENAKQSQKNLSRVERNKFLKEIVEKDVLIDETFKTKVDPIWLMYYQQLGKKCMRFDGGFYVSNGVWLLMDGSVDDENPEL